MRTYSPFFSTIYDQDKPVGDHLGRGTHYSVFRAVSPELDKAFHDFAVIWDEDHDDRIVWVIEHLMVAGLFRPVITIGERKGTVTVLTRPLPRDRSFKAYSLAVEKIAASMPYDCFACEVDVFPGPSMLISADDSRVKSFLNGIKDLWLLGEKPAVFYNEPAYQEPAADVQDDDGSDPAF